MPTIIENEKLKNELIAMISEIVEMEPEKITPMANFVEDLGMDSMMALEILASIEKKYKIRIPEENLPKLINLSKAIELASEFINK
jgi:acyl carrier protein